MSSPATVHVHINHLVDKGFIKRSKEGNRALELLVENEYDTRSKEVVNVPILGKITKSSPIEAIETPEEFFSLPSCLVPEDKEVFVLSVDGDSMINKGIFSNDIVIIEKCEFADNGDMVVVSNDENEVFFKTFYKENGYFRLQPENDVMEPIILDSVTILGKAIGLYRKF